MRPKLAHVAKVNAKAPLANLLGVDFASVYPKAPRTHILRLLGPKTILYKAFGLL